MGGDGGMKGGQSFGKFIAKHHDLERAFTKLKLRAEEQEKMLYEVRVELSHAAVILRLGGYTEAANSAQQMLTKVNKWVMRS
jgi:hypothetical protein